MPANYSLRVIRRVPAGACAVLVALSLTAAPGWAQSQGTTCAGYTFLTLAQCAPNNGCTALTGDFYSNFVGSGNLATYGYALSSSSGGTFQGDLNSAYSEVYYSILNALTNNGGSTSNPSCFELVIAGAFPNVRYFAITDNDMHYASAQHLADAAMDTAKQGQANPFTPKVHVNGQQMYVVPISLGSVPSGSGIWPGCGISPFEQDNLLDGTQRHPSMDWNTVVSSLPCAPGEFEPCRG